MLDQTNFYYCHLHLTIETLHIFLAAEHANVYRLIRRDKLIVYPAHRSFDLAQPTRTHLLVLMPLGEQIDREPATKGCIALAIFDYKFSR